jgi:S-adenosylmethionine:tRNA ribosyltransferase-isomerase
VLNFELPPELEAGEPPEARGLERDEVRLLVSHRGSDGMQHARFRDLGDYLDEGDLLVINTSGTLNASLPAMRAGGSEVELHLSTCLDEKRWTGEFRTVEHGTTAPLFSVNPGETMDLPQGARVQVLSPYPPGVSGPTRLWVISLDLPFSHINYLEKFGSPIRYHYVRASWPGSYYQTVFATEPGSAEMPSAGRPFTPEMVTRLVAKGVLFAPILLHTGVASQEDHEPPYDEYYRVSESTARLVNATRAAGRRVIAVGTTVVRALETVTDESGTAHHGEGFTGVVVTASRGARSIDGLLTGLHEPRATHLSMLEALVERRRLSAAYSELLRHRYLWHEFGDMHLILP